MNDCPASALLTLRLNVVEVGESRHWRGRSRLIEEAMAFSSPDEQRAILSLSFEPAAEGFIYYHKAWSRGIPVTAGEREAYLSIPVLGSRQAWRSSLANRQSFPPRSYWPTLHKLLAAMPIHIALFGGFFGAMAVLSGLSAENWALKLIWLVGGIALAAFGLGILIARVVPQQINGS